MDLVPSLWDELDQRIRDREIVATKEVYVEISQKDDDLLEWVRERREMFIEVDDQIQQKVDLLVNRYPNWVDHESQKNEADPYVVALAMQHDLTVVSFERGGGPAHVKIPYVCHEMKVPHLLLFDFLRAIGFSA